MLFPPGPRPAAICDAWRAGVAFLICLILFSVSMAPSVAQAEAAAPLTLAEAEDKALDQEPGQAAYLARAEALADQSVAAGQLPDPKLRVGLANFPIESGGFTTENMTQAVLGYRQSFPPSGTRAASTARFQSLSEEMHSSADARGRDVLTAVRNAWFDTYYWERAQELALESRPLFADLVTVTRSLYSVGRRDQQDLLRAELELSRLDDRLIDIGNQLARARAALSEWVGRDANRPLPPSLPKLDTIPALEMLRINLLTHPVLMAADARLDARQADIDLAKRAYKPGWELDLGYGYRDGMLSTGGSRSDFISVMVQVELPFFQENRQDRRHAAALSERRAANHSKDKLLRRLNSDLDAEYARWQELNRRIELYQQSILPLAEDQALAALAAYQSEAGDFADVMRGSIDEFETQLDFVRLQVERAQTYAVLANLGGLSQ